MNEIYATHAESVTEDDYDIIGVWTTATLAIQQGRDVEGFWFITRMRLNEPCYAVRVWDSVADIERLPALVGEYRRHWPVGFPEEAKEKKNDPRPNPDR